MRTASKESSNVLEIKAERPDWVGHVEGRTVSRRKTTEEIYGYSERRNNVNCCETRESMDRVRWRHVIGLLSLLKETTKRKSRRKQRIGSSSPNWTFYNIFPFFCQVVVSVRWLLAWCAHWPWVFLKWQGGAGPDNSSDASALAYIPNIASEKHNRVFTNSLWSRPCKWAVMCH